MATTLTDPGEVTYNGYTLPMERRCLGVSIMPNRDSAGRTTTGVRYSAAWRFYVLSTNGTTPTDTEIEQIREDLTRNGGSFTWSNSGFGNIAINQNGGNSDLEWGPWTELRWLNPTDDLACEVEFRITWVASECTNYPYGNLMEFCWSADFQLGLDRLEQRTIRGHYRIPLSKKNVNSAVVMDSADSYYPKIIGLPPVGWERSNESRTLSEDKCRVDFSYTDNQQMTPKPPGVKDYRFEHSFQNLDAGFYTVNNTMTGYYEMMLHAPMALSLTYFVDAVRDRLGYIQQFVAARPVNDKIASTILPTGFSARHSVHNRSAEYSLTFRTVGRLTDVLASSMWRQLPNHDFDAWAFSMRGANRPGGFAQTIIGPDDDAIVDLCSTAKPRIAKGGPSRPGNAERMRLALQINCPHPNESWVEYDLKLLVEVDGKIVEHEPLPTKLSPTSTTPGGLSLGEIEVLKRFGGQEGLSLVPLVGNVATSKDDAVITQRRGKPVVRVYLIGRVMRTCYPIDPPRLTRVGEAEAISSNRPGHEYFVSSVKQGVLPIYIASFKLRWTLKKMPKKPIAPPGTPVVEREINEEWIHNNDGANGP